MPCPEARRCRSDHLGDLLAASAAKLEPAIVLTSRVSSCMCAVGRAPPGSSGHAWSRQTDSRNSSTASAETSAAALATGTSWVRAGGGVQLRPGKLEDVLGGLPPANTGYLEFKDRGQVNRGRSHRLWRGDWRRRPTGLRLHGLRQMGYGYSTGAMCDAGATGCGDRPRRAATQWGTAITHAMRSRDKTCSTADG